MPVLSFATLSHDQRAQVHSLFADDVFGTDPRTYRYEINSSGDVTGRINDQPPSLPKRAHQSAPVKVTIMEAPITDATLQHARMSMDALAASIAEKLYQSNLKLEEVHV